MKQILTALAIVLVHFLSAQTAVTNASFTFAGGVYPTFSVTFPNTDAKTVEGWFKDQLKPISGDVTNKKELMAVGVRLPEVSGDTIRVFVRTDQPKKNPDVVLHVAFRVNGTFVGPDSEQRQMEGCRNWMYQRAVMLKKELAQKELDAATKQQQRLESDLAGLVKEKDRAQNNIEKTQGRISSDQKDKVDVDAEKTTLQTKIEAKKLDVTTNATEANTKELQAMVKQDEKLGRKSADLDKDAENGKKKIETLQDTIKKNLEDQDAKSKAIEVQKKVVEDLRAKLAAVN